MRFSLVTKSVMRWRFHDATMSKQTKEEINFDCFSLWLTHCLLAWEGQAWWNIVQEEKSVLCTSCWLVIFLSLNVFHCMWSNEWNPYNSYQGDCEKMAIKRAALSQFISLCNCLLLQLSSCFAHKLTHTSSSSSSWSLSVLSNLHLNLWLFLHLVPHSSFLNPTILSPLLHLDTLLLASQYTSSHLCITDTLINPGFVLVLKRSSMSFWLHINWSVRTQVRIVKYLSRFSSLALFF